jgi:membrane protease YdiL (CAAX protease family)
MDMPERPPGSGTFSLEGRPAPGLYLIAWLLSGLGLGVVFIAFQTTPPVAGVLLMAGLMMVLGGLSASAGYQLVARAGRDVDAYRGPSPLLLLAIWFVAVNVLGILLSIAGLADTSGPVGLLAVGLLQTALYVAVVWLFVVRSGAMSWRDMRHPAGSASAGTLADAGYGAGVMLPTTAGALLLAAAVALLLGTRAPQVIPIPQTPIEIGVVALVAALLIPIGEEVFFRGYSLTAWLRDLGPRSALIRSTVFFAAIHIANVRIDPVGETFEAGLRQAALVLAVILPVGAVLGWLMLRRGLVASIVGHITYNGILIGLLVASTLVPTPA